ncbi:hypothetical protein HL653_16785 [Sphingomonas sp. AP4-R1]|uniref:hypothetical protein n=1 Tax=Sphingomonas sp. AP4-R1 TaxID=2735134 RepID=UPI0014933071|nr:hypothetical protein [Sphingomonas sp. AP4-R1]QJU59197.1 hypothetical protein HL653_16785 [Sphingomonas sp. AP4-R1]
MAGLLASRDPRQQIGESGVSRRVSLRAVGSAKRETDGMGKRVGASGTFLPTQNRGLRSVSANFLIIMVDPRLCGMKAVEPEHVKISLRTPEIIGRIDLQGTAGPPALVKRSDDPFHSGIMIHGQTSTPTNWPYYNTHGEAVYFRDVIRPFHAGDAR